MDVRHHEGNATMNQRRQMREMRPERWARLALRTAVRVEHGRCRTASAARSVHEARDVAVRARDSDQLRVDELAPGNPEARSEGDSGLAGGDVERPHLPRLGWRETRERHA